MAIDNSDWIPVEISGPVVTAMKQVSALESVGTGVPMQSETKKTPIPGSFDVAVKAPGVAYATQSGTAATVLLTAYQFGGSDQITREDLNDSAVDIVENRMVDATNSMALWLDNASFAVTAAANGGSVPFNSVYHDVKTNHSGNVFATSGALSYADFSDALGVVEASNYYEPQNLVIVADPSFLSQFRAIVDGNGKPIFAEAVYSANSPGVSTLQGIPVVWSNALKTSSVATKNPASAGALAHPLLIVTNKRLLIRGDARLVNGTSVPAVALDNSLGFYTETVGFKIGVRRGFVLADSSAVGIVEKTA